MTDTQTTDAKSHAKSHAEIQGLLRDEISALKLMIDARFNEIATLTALLEGTPIPRSDQGVSPQEIEDLKQRHALEMALVHALYTSWRNGPATGVPPFSTQISALTKSGFFNAKWYLSQYPDLAGMDMAPEEHYVRSGGFEGRNPGPEFNTMKYYLANPDLANAGWPALVHYIILGQSEGRSLG